MVRGSLSHVGVGNLSGGLNTFHLLLDHFTISVINSSFEFTALPPPQRFNSGTFFFDSVERSVGVLFGACDSHVPISRCPLVNQTGNQLVILIEGISANTSGQ